MKEKERIAEIEHLSRIMKEIDSQLAVASENHAKAQAALDQSIAEYWDSIFSDAQDEAQFIENIARQRILTAASYRRCLQLTKLQESAYFARIDFQESHPHAEPESRPVYIGLASLSDPQSHALLIYDWRSPIAGMFYDFGRGPAHYLAPGGKISGTITLKRQYKIDHGQIIYMFDSDLKIDDEILQALLSKSADSKMRTIVTSIQREQNLAIRDETHRVLFVRGPAGSGKTSIALHRAAYLLYRDRRSLTAQNILIFSPNRIFSDYISNVLPELGEENIRQMMFQDYLLRALSSYSVDVEERDAQLEYLYLPEDSPDRRIRMAGIAFKSSPAFAAIIHRYLETIEKEIAALPDVEFEGRQLIPRDEWAELFSKTLTYLPMAKRLAQLRKTVYTRLRPIIRQLREDEALHIAATGEEVNERTIRALARLNVRKRMEPFYSALQERTELNPLALYRRLFEDGDLFRRLAKDESIPDEWPAVCQMTLEAMDNQQIFYEDSLPLLFLQGVLEGFTTYSDIRHLIIDEAQDYTLFHYEILKRLFPKCSWTVLGDPAQSIHPYLHTADFETASRILADASAGTDEDTAIIQLSRSYRSTYEIQRFAEGILGENTAKPIHRSGRRPILVQAAGSEDMANAVIRQIGLFQQEGWKSVAVICKTLQDAAAAYEKLSQHLDIHLITPESIEFKRGIVIAPAYLAKGLEFDAVIIYNVNDQTYRSAMERNILYTVCTRALHRLALVYSGNLSPLLSEVDPKTFETETGRH